MDSGSGSSSVRIEQLTDRNCASWLGEIELLLEQRRILSIVEEKETVPELPSTEAVVEAVREKAAQYWKRHGVARSTILLV
jgi:Holliday junction resolvase-like predicted endonuclease